MSIPIAPAVMTGGDAFANAKVEIISSSSKKRIQMIISTDTHELRGIKKLK